MKVFFDTEFTGLHKDTTLISIGMVDENGRSLYIEFNDYDKSQVDDWIRKNVIAHLENDETMTKKEASEAIKKWLMEYDTVQLVSDCSHYDMVLLVDLFGTAMDIPKTVTPVCHDINQDIAKYYDISERDAFDLSREKIIKGFKISGNKHNSLYDARVIRQIYKIINYEKS